MSTQADNIRKRLATMPTFKPSSARTFGDWSLEAGDIITVENNGKTNTLPVFSADMDWTGMAMTTLASNGNEVRPVQEKQKRESYNDKQETYDYIGRAVEGALSKAEQTAVSLVATAKTELGGVIKAGFAATVHQDEQGNWIGASELFTTNAFTNQVNAKIGVYSVTSGDTTKTFANILADQVDIDARLTTLAGALVVTPDGESSGTVITSDRINANQVSAGKVQATLEFVVGGSTYGPTTITSSDMRVHTVLGR